MKLRFSILLTCFDELKFPQILTLFFLLGLLAYRDTIFFPFVHDDIVFIQQNPHISFLTNLREVFRAGHPIIPIANSYWRPAL